MKLANEANVFDNQLDLTEEKEVKQQYPHQVLAHVKVAKGKMTS